LCFDYLLFHFVLLLHTTGMPPLTKNYSFSLGNCPRQAECTIRVLCLQIYRASAGNVRRSKDEIEADKEVEDEYGYTTSEYRHCYFMQTVLVNASCFVCMMFGAFACHCILFSCYRCVRGNLHIQTDDQEILMHRHSVRKLLVQKIV
jgi:hypothetical protein